MPLTFPSVGITDLTMRLKRVVSVSESPFTLDTQVYTHQGARWECEVTLPPLTYTEAKQVEAFIIGLKGRSGTFTFGNPLHTSNANATLASAADARDETLDIAVGGSAVDAGTYFQIGNYLYITTADKSAGAGTLHFQPPLKESIAISQACDFTQPKSLWRMASNDVGWSVNQASLYGFTFAFVEAL